MHRVSIKNFMDFNDVNKFCYIVGKKLKTRAEMTHPPTLVGGVQILAGDSILQNIFKAVLE